MAQAEVLQQIGRIWFEALRHRHEWSELNRLEAASRTGGSKRTFRRRRDRLRHRGMMLHQSASPHARPTWMSC